MNPETKIISKRSWLDKAMTPTNDHLERRCPRLGGTVEFSYCRCAGENGIPCWKVFDCWWEIFDVVAYFKGRLDKETFEQIVNTRPKPKITSILEIVEQAKKRMAEDCPTEPDVIHEHRLNHDAKEEHEETDG